MKKVGMTDIGIDLNSVIQSFIKPEPMSIKKRFFTNREELEEKRLKGQRLKDLVRTNAWQTDIKEIIEKSFREGFGTLLRPTSLDMSESALKAILAGMQAHLGYVSTIIYHMEEGNAASIKLERIKKK